MNSFTSPKFFFIAPSANHVLKILCNLSSSNSPGNDQIIPSLILLAKDLYSMLLSHICTLSINTSIFPDCLKIAQVTPLHKGGGYKLDNLRPISVLPYFSKIIEKVLTEKVAALRVF